MSFYSYKNANADVCPGAINNNALTGLNRRMCIQVKNVYDSCMKQEQLDEEEIVISNIVPVLPSDCRGNNSASCSCTCQDNECECTCPGCGAGITHEQAVENAENSPCPLPQPCGTWTFESCRSSTIKGKITNLCIERLCRPSAIRPGKMHRGRADRRALCRSALPGMARAGRGQGRSRCALVHPRRFHHPLHPGKPCERDLRIRLLHRQLHLRNYPLRHCRPQGACRGGHHGADLWILRDPALRRIRGSRMR